MHIRKLFITILSGCLLLTLISCGSANKETVVEAEPVPEAHTVAAEQVEIEPVNAEQESRVVESVLYRTDNSTANDSLRRSNRMIIKNATLSLLVADTDVAIDRTTQIVSDVGGYIISSRVWYEEWADESFKYSSLTVGVPSAAFERSLRRFREIAEKVTNENTYGEDVTDQYVDLQSQLINLRATRDRIMGFLEQAENVEEALAVNEELSIIEGQMEEIQGQINYLTDRSAYSTISILMEPELPEIQPTPTPTPLPTATPYVWDASKSFRAARAVLSETYTGLAELVIWFGVVFVPVLGPPALVGIIILRWRKQRAEVKKKDSGSGPE